MTLRLQGSPIVAFGRSLGGAVSVALAQQHPDLVKGLVLENTFASIPAMVDIMFPYVSVLKPLVCRISWDSLTKIRRLKQHMLFISGDSDGICRINIYTVYTSYLYVNIYIIYACRAGPSSADEAAVRGGRAGQGEGALQRLGRASQRHLAHRGIQLLQGSLMLYILHALY